MTLSFYGGVEQVTGACYLLEGNPSAGSGRAAKILVDCGLFQCPLFCSERNNNPFPFDVRLIDALFITHAHIDHIGRIPKLIREGFRGKIYSTAPTKDFAAIMLEDSLGILEKEASAGKKGILYKEEDIAKALSLWEAKEYYDEIGVGDVKVRLSNAGHILGSAMVEVVVGGEKVIFSGDLGNITNPLLPLSDEPKEATYLVLESTYGDRIHEDAPRRKTKFERVIENAVHRGGTLLIPAFSLERTQELLFELNSLVENERIPKVKVFIDSPLAIKATEIYKTHSRFFSKEAKRIIKSGDDLFRFPNLSFTKSTEESRAINDVSGPKIIIAGAGMMQGGRILHHAKRYLSDPQNSILFIGYQSAGSLGRRILERERQVTILGEHISVLAEVYAIGGYSAHADYEKLMGFVEKTRDTLKKVFLVQGEPRAALFLAQRVRDYLGVFASLPHFGETVEL